MLSYLSGTCTKITALSPLCSLADDSGMLLISGQRSQGQVIHISDGFVHVFISLHICTDRQVSEFRYVEVIACGDCASSSACT